MMRDMRAAGADLSQAIEITKLKNLAHEVLSV
jgi:hypothetical protein